MAKSPAFQFYPKDFLSDGNVAVMSMEQVGAYITLLSYCWLENSLPDDVSKLAFMCKVSRKKMLRIWDVLRPCFKKRQGKWVHQRLVEERKKQKAYSQSRSFNAKHTVNKGVAKKTHGQHMLNTCDPLHTASTSPINNIYPPSFEEFWKKYPCRNGKRIGKSRAFKTFCKLKSSDIDIINKTAVVNYANSKQAKGGYAKDPERFLKSDYWKDWLTEERYPENKSIKTENPTRSNQNFGDLIKQTASKVGIK